MLWSLVVSLNQSECRHKTYRHYNHMNLYSHRGVIYVKASNLTSTCIIMHLNSENTRVVAVSCFMCPVLWLISCTKNIRDVVHTKCEFYFFIWAVCFHFIINIQIVSPSNYGPTNITCFKSCLYQKFTITVKEDTAICMRLRVFFSQFYHRSRIRDVHENTTRWRRYKEEFP